MKLITGEEILVVSFIAIIVCSAVYAIWLGTEQGAIANRNRESCIVECRDTRASFSKGDAGVVCLCPNEKRAERE